MAWAVSYIQTRAPFLHLFSKGNKWVCHHNVALAIYIKRVYLKANEEEL
jgi:hypothetical protein